MSHRLFHCPYCGKSETTSSSFIDPVCCQKGMVFERTLFAAAAKPDEIQLDLIERADGDPFAAPTGVFEKPPWWKESWEVWALRGGRQHGERLGWLGLEVLPSALVGAPAREAWHFQMTPGVKTRTGTHTSQPEAVHAMLHAIMET